MMKKKLIAALLAATVAAGTMPSAGALLDGFTASRTYSNQFTDVPTNAWYYNSVKTAYELGLTSGTSAITFSPKKSVNVNETTAFLARIHAVYTGNEITGQPDASWSSKYYDYVTDFIDSGYMGDGLYELATEPRWEFAYQLSKALPDCEYTEINYIPDGQIPDLPVSQYGYDVVTRIYMLYRAGILSGNDAYGTFAPNSNVTRAEVTAIISRMIDPAQRKTFTLKDKPKFALNGFAGSYFTSLGDPNRSWMGYTLNISSTNSNGIYFTFQYDKSGHAVGFTTQKAIFTSATTATANGTTYYADQPAKKIAVKYYFTFSDYNINFKIYQNGSIMYNIDFDCNGTVG